MVSFEDLMQLEHGAREILRNNVRFTDSNGRSFTGSICSGVTSKRLKRTLFYVNINGRFQGQEFVLSPKLKFNTKKYSKGALFTTKSGNVIFVPDETMKKLLKELAKSRT